MPIPSLAKRGKPRDILSGEVVSPIDPGAWMPLRGGVASMRRRKARTPSSSNRFPKDTSLPANALKNKEQESIMKTNRDKLVKISVQGGIHHPLGGTARITGGRQSCRASAIGGIT